MNCIAAKISLFFKPKAKRAKLKAKDVYLSKPGQRSTQFLNSFSIFARLKSLTLFPIIIIIAWSIIGIQLIYLITLLIAFFQKPEIGIDATPPVSIIICAHDEEENLKQLIPLLLLQDYPHFEVIIVEDRSNDDTFDYLLDLTKQEERIRMVRVRHLPEHLNGKKFALTLGLKAAAHEWILLTDADCRPVGNDWIKSMASHFKNDKQIVLGYSPYTKAPGYLNDFIRFESLVTAVQFIGWASLGKPYMGTGRNLAYRKKLFFDNRGFNDHQSIMGGDDDLFVNANASKSNTAVCVGQSSLMMSEPKKTWKDFYYQKLRHLSVGKRYKFSDKVVLGLFSMTWVLNWLLVAPILFFEPAITAYLWTGFLLREILLISVIHKSSRTLGDGFEAWKTPLLDFNYGIYYLGTGLVALVSKRIRWKK